MPACFKRAPMMSSMEEGSSVGTTASCSRSSGSTVSNLCNNGSGFIRCANRHESRGSSFIVVCTLPHCQNNVRALFCESLALAKRNPCYTISKSFFFIFLTSNMEILSQLVTQEDCLGLQVLRITHHCYGLALNTSRSPHKEASAWKSCFTPRNTGPAGISPAKLHIIVGCGSGQPLPYSMSIGQGIQIIVQVGSYSLHSVLPQYTTTDIKHTVIKPSQRPHEIGTVSE
jgi:hypothetical protein